MGARLCPSHLRTIVLSLSSSVSYFFLSTNVDVLVVKVRICPSWRDTATEVKCTSLWGVASNAARGPSACRDPRQRLRLLSCPLEEGLRGRRAVGSERF